MSLIYQALKQTEQQATVPVAAGVRPAPAPLPDSVAPPAAWFQKPLWTGGLIAAVGVAAGTFLALDARTVASAPAAVWQAPAPLVVAASTPPPAPPRLGTDASLPTVTDTLAAPRGLQQVLPVTQPASPAPRPERALVSGIAEPGAPKSLPPPVPVGAVAAAPQAPPVLPVRVAGTAVAAAAPPPTDERNEAVVPEVSPPVEARGAEPEDLGELFDALNRALASKDEPQAQRLLRAVQARLPAGATARWRAEAWFAYQTADLDRARHAYRRLLEKVPGDENATLTLVAIEQQQQRPDLAREVLSRSLRHNHNSAALRSALNQLTQGEAAR